jgi:hypothetical protein
VYVHQPSSKKESFSLSPIAIRAHDMRLSTQKRPAFFRGCLLKKTLTLPPQDELLFIRE